MTNMVASAIRGIALLALALTLAACATNRTPWGREIVKDVYCTYDRDEDGTIEESEKRLYVPVELSRSDTDGTIEQTLVNNRTHDETCGVDPETGKRVGGGLFRTGGIFR